MNLKSLLQRLAAHWEIMIVIILALAFFVFSSSFNYLSQDKDFVKWLSPDETANYTVAKAYAQTGSLQFFEKYNLLSEDLIHPRSFRSDWGWIKPVSFIGLPLLYGSIAKIFGVGVLPYLTPFFGALGIILFYLWIKRLFGRENALVSTVLLACFPVYVYFSARSFFHNILFMVACLAGLYFGSLMVSWEKDQKGKMGDWRRRGTVWFFSLLSGAGFGLAVTARGSELLWLAPLLIALFIYNIRSLSLPKIAFFLAGLLAACLPVYYWNQVLYGSWYASGYPELNSSLGTLGQNGSELASTAAKGRFFDLKPLLAKAKMTLFHFGFNPGQSLRMFDAYVKDMFPWLFWSLAAGLLLFLASFRQYTKARWIFLLGWGAVSGLLIVYYGSWVFFDNPDPRSFTIGNSYTRYWLPFYLGALPFASFLLLKVTSLLKQRYLVLLVRLLALAAVVVISAGFVWNDRSEGLAVSIEKQGLAEEEWRAILEQTEKNAVIITRYHDKVLFPERKVIIGLFNDKNMIKIYADLAQRLPVYYYNFSFQVKDLAYLNDGVLKEAGIRLETVAAVTDRFTLYRVVVNTIK